MPVSPPPLPRRLRAEAGAGPGFSRGRGFGLKSGRPLLAVASFLLAGALVAAHAAPAGWVWCGAVTPTTAIIKAKLPGGEAQPLRLVAAKPAGSARLVAPASAVKVAGGMIVTYALTGLAPDTLYHYEVSGQAGRFRAFPAGPQSFTVAFGSCAETGSEHPVFASVAKQEPLLFLHLGDLHYEDIAANNPGAFHAAFDRVLASAAQSSLYGSTAIDYVWDDHDYGAKPADALSPGHAAARRAYQEAVPHYPLAPETIGHAFTIGRVRFIVTDARSGREPPRAGRRSLLGAAQKEWLKGELLAARSEAALIVWVNPVPWIAAAQEGADHWGGFAEERRELAVFIEQHDIRQLCMLSGDAHMLAIDDGRHNRYGGEGRPLFPVFQAAALDRSGSRKGGPYSHGAFPGSGQFGLMRVSDDGGDEIRVEWTGRNAADEVLVRHEFKVARP